LGRFRRGLLGTQEGGRGHFPETFDMGFQGGVKIAERGLNLSAFRYKGASTQFLDRSL
jgi:hypothetical protein